MKILIIKKQIMHATVCHNYKSKREYFITL